MENFESLPLEQQEQMLNRPALEAPEGITYNFENPPNHNSLALAVIVISTVIVTVSGLLRLYSRVFVSKKLFIEDCKLPLLLMLPTRD